ncbi:RHS repeat-associated core domain-containing protein [Planctomycetota bacterium]
MRAGGQNRLTGAKKSRPCIQVPSCRRKSRPCQEKRTYVYVEIVWVYQRARYYDSKTGTFNRLDPFAGNPDDPQSFHKYRYTHGDPIQFADPTGMFEGIVGLLGSMNIQISNRAAEQSNTAQGAATAHRLQKLAKVVRKMQRIVSKIEDAKDMFDSATNILDLTKSEGSELKNSFSILSAIPVKKIGPHKVKLPAKATQKLRTIINLAKKFGGINYVQEAIGEMAVSLAGSVTGFEHTSLRMHAVQGIDQLRRNPNVGWAVFEAKGGRSRLGKASYGRQMSPDWIRHWLDDTIDSGKNRRNPERSKLLALRNLPRANPFLAAIVRTNARGRRFQMKITANKMDWTTNKLNWRGA